MKRRTAFQPRGFTLLEICLAVLIAMMLVTLAVPSIEGLIADQKRRKSFEQFDALVRRAQTLAVSDRRAYLIARDQAGFFLRPEQSGTGSGLEEGSRFDVGKGESCEIEFPSALLKKPAAEWIFWPTGTCEAANVFYRGAGVAWTARYAPFTARAVFSIDETQ